MTALFPGPAYRIQTPRLILRCWEPRDAEPLQEAISASLDHLRPWMPWAHKEPKGLQAQIDQLRSWRAKFDLGQDFVYGIFDLSGSQVLGGTGLHTRVGDRAREIGYWIRADQVRQGLASETAAALTKVAFEIEQLFRVEIHMDPENQASASVPRKLGYTYEATLRKRTLEPDGVLHDRMIWSMLSEEYPASPCAEIKIEALDAAGRKIL